MAAPATPPVQWATNATHSAPGEAWDGLNTKVAPSAGRIATGWEPEDNPSAEQINYILNNHATWLEYLETLSGETTGQEIHIAPIAGVQGVLGISDWDFGGVGLGPDVDSAANGSTLHFDLSAYLPVGSTITDVEVMIAEGASGRSLGSRASVSILRTTPVWGTPAVPSVTSYYSETDGSTTSAQVFAISDGVNAGTAWPGGGITLDSDKLYALKIQAGTDGTHNPDNIIAIRVLYTHPGIEQVV